MPPVAKNNKVDSNKGTGNTSVNFNTLNYPKESINIYRTGDKSEWESNFSTGTSN